MAATKTIVRNHIPERTSPIVRATLVDEDGDTITVPLTATVTLYDVASGDIINGRAQHDVLDDIAAGVLAWRMEPDDTAVVGSAALEEHVALLEWTWDAGAVTGYGKHEVVHTVRNLTKVPS